MALTNAQTEAGRKSLPLIQAIVVEVEPDDVVLTATIEDKRKLTFSGDVAVTKGATTTHYGIAANNGKIKRFSDIDSMIRAMALVAPTFFAVQQTARVNVVGTSSLAKNEPVSGDPVARLTKERTKLTAANLSLGEKSTDLAASIAASSSYQNGSTKQQEFYNDLVAQKGVVDQLVELYVARIAAIDAALV